MATFPMFEVGYYNKSIHHKLFSEAISIKKTKLEDGNH